MNENSNQTVTLTPEGAEAMQKSNRHRTEPALVLLGWGFSCV